MTSSNEKATTLLGLHQPGNPVILPTVWDAWSANLAVSAGFQALTVGSHPVSDSIGKPDNEGITFDEAAAPHLADHRGGGGCRCRSTSNRDTGSSPPPADRRF